MNFLFCILAFCSLFSSFFVVFSVNPIHSVLGLILAFCFSSGILLLFTVDFLGILFVVVYVGAIAVLFLFVIMMLNLRLVQFTESNVRWIPVGTFVILVVSSEILYVLWRGLGNAVFLDTVDYKWVGFYFGLESLGFFGIVLYNYFFYALLLSALVLLTSLIGAIVLTAGNRRFSRRQLVYKQVGRNVFESVEFYNSNVQE